MINTNVEAFSTYFLNTNEMESHQADQVRKILRTDSKDFLCSSKRNLLCPADDFLSQPETGEDQKKITIGKNWGHKFFTFLTLELNALRLQETQGYLPCSSTLVLVRILTMTMKSGASLQFF